MGSTDGKDEIAKGEDSDESLFGPRTPKAKKTDSKSKKASKSPTTPKTNTKGKRPMDLFGLAIMVERYGGKVSSFAILSFTPYRTNKETLADSYQPDWSALAKAYDYEKPESLAHFWNKVKRDHVPLDRDGNPVVLPEPEKSAAKTGGTPAVLKAK